MRTLIRNATVIPIEPQGQIWDRGAVLIDGDRVADVGPSEEVERRAARLGRTIDAAGKAVLPGFVSAHNHLGYAVFRGRAEDFGFGAGQRLYLPMAAVLSREERLEIGTLAAGELLRGGCTTVLEMEEDADVLVGALDRLGLRACVGVMVNDVDLDALIGSLEVGKRADLQIVDMRRYGLGPVNDPVSTLVYHAHGKDVEAVMVDGEWVVEAGIVRGVDERALVEAAGRACENAWRRFAERFN